MRNDMTRKDVILEIRQRHKALFTPFILELLSLYLLLLKRFGRYTLWPSSDVY